MKCREAENEILSRQHSSAFSPELKAHLSECARCAELMAESEEVDSVFQNAAVLEANPFLWTRIEARLREQGAPSRWFAQLSQWAYAWAAISLLILFSFLLATFENQPPLDPAKMLAQNGLTPEIADSNPFLVAQTETVQGSNPFLEAMMPRGGNPFSQQRGQ